MILMFLAIVITNVIVQVRNKGDWEDRVCLFFLGSLVSGGVSLTVVGIISLGVYGVMGEQSFYDIKVRERPIVALKTKESIKGQYGGNFLAMSGTIEGTTIYSYLVKNSDGIINRRQTEYPNFLIGKAPIERTEVWHCKNPWWNGRLLLIAIKTHDGYTEIILPENCIEQNIKVTP